MKKTLLLILFIVVFFSESFAYSFSSVAPSGQTLYYNISGNTVTVTVPTGNENNGWYGFSKPTGALIIPSSVSSGGTTYLVTNIRTNAFRQCSGLTSVTIPSTVTSIGAGAFKDCSSLTTVYFNAVSCTMLGDYLGYTAFVGCNSLTTVIFGDSVIAIPDRAFESCTGLTNIVIPNSVTSIGYLAFWNCSGITSVTIGTSVTSINNRAFENCSALTTLNYNAINCDTMECFVGCNTLTSVVFGDNVAIIPYRAFESCTGLSSITIPNSVTHIGDRAFELCTGISSITIPNSVTNIGDRAFRDCSGLTTATIGNSVTNIGEYAFYRCNELSSITIPNSVTNIGNSAFALCDSLLSIVIPESVNILGNEVFYYCRGLNTVTIGGSVTNIGNNAFLGCSSLTRTNYTGSIMQWCNITFSSGNSNPISHSQNLYINDTLVNYLVIPDGVTEIKPYAFYNCSTLTSVAIPATVTSIGGSAFSYCGGLTSLSIPSSVINIGISAFSNCRRIASITIPDSVTIIGNNAFYNLRHIEYNGCTTGCPWGALFMNGVKEGDFIYTDSTKHYLVAYSGTGDNVVIPSTIDTIGPIAFYGCHELTYVNIPNSVENIRYSAFEYCTSLDTIQMGSEVAPSIEGSCFDNNAYGRIILIPCGSYNSYYNGSGWCGGSPLFSNYRSALQEPIVNFSIDVLNSNPSYGYVTIVSQRGHDVNCDSTAIVRATSYYGYHFDNWSNGSVASIDTLHLVGDSIVTAFFSKNQYSVVVVANDSIRGSIVGGGTVNYLDTVTLTAISNYGYHFVKWSDNRTENPRQVVATNNITMTAVFEPNQYSLSVQPNTSLNGTCIGGNIFNYQSECTITAIANYGYHFGYWNDGDTNNPRTITLTQDTSFIAVFVPNTYNITLASADIIQGSVTGDTTAKYLDTINFFATANYGYHFSQWNDGDTSNPRFIILTQDTTFTALFSKNYYSMTLSVDSSIHGSVAGAGIYEYQNNCNISATANYGYHFTAWNDGDTNNPRVFMLTQDTSFTALFAKNTYTITAIPNDTIRGIVTGSTSTEYLDSVTITAIPNYGYNFTTWNDGDTSNPRTIEATKDSLFTAYFDYNQYSIILNVDTNIHGSVDGGGLYNYLSEQTITATANYGYHFTVWNDGDTTNPRTITLTQDTVFTALYAKNSYNVTVVSADTIQGNVVGSTTTEYLDTVSIAATANYGYHFLHWNDGDTTNPRVITLMRDTLLTAYFTKNWYSVIGISDNETMGYVTGSDTVEYLDSVSLSATSNYGYHFSSWNDGDTNNPRMVCLTQDTSFVALFAKNQYALTVQSNDETQGSVSNGGVFDYLDTVTIIASASEHYHFVRWDDGNTDNPREYVVVNNATLMAIFAIDTHTVSVATNDILHGCVDGGGEYEYGSPCTVTATAYSGYRFVQWSNGSTYNPYTFAVTTDIELTAMFIEEGSIYNITATSADPSMGTVTGGGPYGVGEEATLTAVPFDGYLFDRWDDGNTLNPRTITVTSDATYIAYFVATQSIDDVIADAVKVYILGGQIVVETNQKDEISIYDIVGRKVDGGRKTRFDVPASGVYLVKIGTLPTQKVVVVK